MSGPGAGAAIIQRLHRLVRHGFRPWLGFDVASGQDGDIHLRRHDLFATLDADATLHLTPPQPGAPAAESIPGTDHAAFDARFPPNTRNRRNLARRLYEIGFLAPR